ncbi:hypothetical protein [Streptomyces hygroscopicus]|uniref:hypothetical protein n=1 Tax=Streptomyces hygroscopicus TaxID=1912 RepID=UPI001FCCA76D|nr:hypothetical protein [Streptomyces hygroscopicus]BDH12557.1 hypothetical protein HOK021_37360 [Streptomyces hygroscopicus]
MSDSEFAVQVAAKLKGITKEIDELQKLRSKLEDLQQHLGTSPQEEAVAAPQPVETDTTAPKPVTVPAARRAKSAAPKAKPAKKAPAKAAKTAAGAKKARKATPAKGKARQRNSTRVDRVLGLLDEQPRTVTELTKLLAQEHPDHTAPETAVRNTLETSLVAKGLAHRSKQGRSVFYSLPAAAPEAGTEAQETDAADAHEEAATARA